MKNLAFLHYAIGLAASVYFAYQACLAPKGVVAWLPAAGCAASVALVILSILWIGHEQRRR